MKILIISDCSFPQVNGVVTTIQATKRCLEIDHGDIVQIIDPSYFRTIPSSYPDVPFSVDVWPVAGPQDIVVNGYNGWLSENLEDAIWHALRIDRDNCREFAMSHNWSRATDTFRSNLPMINPLDFVSIQLL